MENKISIPLKKEEASSLGGWGKVRHRVGVSLLVV